MEGIESHHLQTLEKLKQSQRLEHERVSKRLEIVSRRVANNILGISGIG